MNAHHNDTHIVGQLGTSALGPISKQIELDVDFNYWGPPEEYEQWVPTGLPHKAYYITPDNPSSEISGSTVRRWLPSLFRGENTTGRSRMSSWTVQSECLSLRRTTQAAT